MTTTEQLIRRALRINRIVDALESDETDHGAGYGNGYLVVQP